MHTHEHSSSGGCGVSGAAVPPAVTAALRRGPRWLLAQRGRGGEKPGLCPFPSPFPQRRFACWAWEISKSQKKGAGGKLGLGWRDGARSSHPPVSHPRTLQMWALISFWTVPVLKWAPQDFSQCYPKLSLLLAAGIIYFSFPVLVLTWPRAGSTVPRPSFQPKKPKSLLGSSITSSSLSARRGKEMPAPPFIFKKG